MTEQQEPYTFEEQLTMGCKHEEYLDKVLEEHFRVEKVTAREQRQGIDRTLCHKETLVMTTVEIKADERAAATGNLFAEVAQRKNGRLYPGWVQKCRAQTLLYYTPGNHLVYVLPLADLRDHIASYRYGGGWQNDWPMGHADNQDHNTGEQWRAYGYLLNLNELRRAMNISVQEYAGDTENDPTVFCSRWGLLHSEEPTQLDRGQLHKRCSTFDTERPLPPGQAATPSHAD